MAICRFGDDSDVYVFEGPRGIYVDVTSNGGVFYNEATDEFTVIPTGHAHDGATYVLTTASETVYVLTWLRSEGYLVPPWVIVSLLTRELGNYEDDEERWCNHA